MTFLHLVLLYFLKFPQLHVLFLYTETKTIQMKKFTPTQMCPFYLAGLSSVCTWLEHFFFATHLFQVIPFPWRTLLAPLRFSKPSPPFKLLGFLFFQEVSGTFPVIDHPPSEHLYHSFIHTICEAREC